MKDAINKPWQKFRRGPVGRFIGSWSYYIVNAPVVLLWGSSAFTAKHKADIIINSAVAGAYIGAGALGIFHRIMKKHDERLRNATERLDRLVWEHRTEQRIRQKYSQQSTTKPSVNRSGLEEY